VDSAARTIADIVPTRKMTRRKKIRKISFNL
jgi:hypothetical protein